MAQTQRGTATCSTQPLHHAPVSVDAFQYRFACQHQAVRDHHCQHGLDVIRTDELRASQAGFDPRRAQQRQRTTGRQAQGHLRMFTRCLREIEHIAAQFRCHVYGIGAGARRCQQLGVGHGRYRGAWLAGPPTATAP